MPGNRHSDDDRRIWNQQEPVRDRELFLDKFAHVLGHGGYSADQAVSLAEGLLPDLVTYDYSSAAGYPNGLRLPLPGGTAPGRTRPGARPIKK